MILVVNRHLKRGVTRCHPLPLFAGRFWLVLVLLPCQKKTGTFRTGAIGRQIAFTCVAVLGDKTEITMQKLILSVLTVASIAWNALGAGPVLPNPILFVTQTPNPGDFTTVAS